MVSATAAGMSGVSQRSAPSIKVDYTPPNGDAENSITFTNNLANIGLIPNYVPPEETGRDAWTNKLQFTMTMIGYAVGLGNVWRYPYLCYKNGGGAFLIPFIVMVGILGMPLFLMEMSVGQFASLGPIAVWRISPLFKGLGYAMVTISWLIGLYYNVVISHCVYYLVISIWNGVQGKALPWTTCTNDWNTKACLSHDAGNRTNNGSYANESLVLQEDWGNVTKTPSEEYYILHVLKLSASIDEFGWPSWHLSLCLLGAWIVVLLALIKGVQSLGKVVYFTALFPYLMLTIMLIRGLTLPGSLDGIAFYIRPNFTRLYDARVWCDAATQIFYSISACSGGIIAMASYNNFSHNCYRDCLLIVLLDAATSIFSGCVIFSVLGFMAREKQVSVADVAVGGPGLAFEVYPEALSRMPIAPLWAICFFFMMCTLGFGSEFSIIECVLCAYSDELKGFLQKSKWRQVGFRALVIIITCLLGMPMVANGGMFLLNLVDFSVGGFPLLIIGLLECIVIGWIYGLDRFSGDIKLMTKSEPNIFWRFCWKYLSPLIIILIIIFNILQYKPPVYGGVPYPPWATALGWLITFLPILIVLVYAIYFFCSSGAWIICEEAVKPLETWGPATRKDHEKFINMIISNEDLRQTHQDGLFQSHVSLVNKLSRAVSKDSGLNIIVQPRLGKGSCCNLNLLDPSLRASSTTASVLNLEHADDDRLVEYDESQS